MSIYEYIELFVVVIVANLIADKWIVPGIEKWLSKRLNKKK